MENEYTLIERKLEVSPSYVGQVIVPRAKYHASNVQEAIRMAKEDGHVPRNFKSDLMLGVNK